MGVPEAQKAIAATTMANGVPKMIQSVNNAYDEFEVVWGRI